MSSSPWRSRSSSRSRARSSAFFFLASLVALFSSSVLLDTRAPSRSISSAFAIILLATTTLRFRLTVGTASCSSTPTLPPSVLVVTDDVARSVFISVFVSGLTFKASTPATRASTAVVVVGVVVVVASSGSSSSDVRRIARHSEALCISVSASTSFHSLDHVDDDDDDDDEDRGTDDGERTFR